MYYSVMIENEQQIDVARGKSFWMMKIVASSAY